MSFLNEVKNLHNIVRKGIRDSSLSLRMTLMKKLKNRIWSKEEMEN